MTIPASLRRALGLLWRSWKYAGKQVATVFAGVLFGFLYIAVVGLYAFWQKVFGTNVQEPRSTYWREKPYRTPTRELLEQPF